MSPSVRHTSKSVEYYTPPYVVDAARQVMGGIDLDPASCARANEIVRATQYFTVRDDGLAQVWRADRVFLNPPGGVDADYESRQRRWWFTLARAWGHGLVEQAVFVAFSVELLQTTQNEPEGPIPLDFPVCFPRTRVQYLRAPRLGARARRAPSPPHASCIVYLPPRAARARKNGIDLFGNLFGAIGRVVNLNLPIHRGEST